MKLCFLAPSGYGKSTAVKLLSSVNSVNIKIAEPLYEMQNKFYESIGIDIGEKQDGEMLQFLGAKVRKENKYFLLDVFKKKVRKAELSNVDLILNDDCRPADYKFLKDLGFLFVKINGIKRDRDDHIKSDDKNELEWQSDIPYDFEIDNYGTIEDYKKQLELLFEAATSIVEKCYIIPSFSCNCNCTFCISKDREFSDLPNKLEINNNFKKSIELVRKRGIKKFEITGGGEPFCNIELQNIINYVRQEIPGSFIKIYTNGNILNSINGVDEINISVSHYDDCINKNIMGGNDISLKEKMCFWKNCALKNNAKLRISLATMKSGINSPDELREFIKRTEKYVDSYVVRTLYNGEADDDFVDFKYDDDRVKWERNNISTNKNIVISTDGLIYDSFDIKNRNYLMSYILLKPDASTYFNEIMKFVYKFGFEIKNMYYMDKFVDRASKLYYLKHVDYFTLVRKHLETTSKLFGDSGIVLVLDKETSIEKIYLDTCRLKNAIRNHYGLSHSVGGYINFGEGNYQLNIAHCPDARMEYFNKDLALIEDMKLDIISKDEEDIIKLYNTFHLKAWH